MGTEKRKPRLKKRFCAGIAWRRNPENGDLEFLVIDYERKVGDRIERDVKFPGGTEDFPNESVLDILKREWKKEVGGTIFQIRHEKDGNEPWPIFKVVDGPKDNPRHVKGFFILDPEDWDGVIRTEEIVDREEAKPDETLGIPRWASEYELDRTIYRGHELPFRSAVAAVMKIEAAANSDSGGESDDE